MRYFEAFPKINGNPDLTFVVKLRDILLNDPKTFYPYTVEDGETPDMIALDYYGNHDRTWIVLMSNNIINPHTQWPLSTSQVNKEVVRVYGSVRNAIQTIIGYEKDGIVVSPESFGYDGAQSIEGWKALNAYDKMIEDNDALRNIRLLDLRFAEQAERELRSLSNE